MKSTHRHFFSNLIISSSFNLKQLIESLSFAARQAYFLRDYTRLKIIGERLVNLSPHSESIGRYYSLLANRKLWVGDWENLVPQLESLADDAPLFIRAAAMSSIAGLEINSGKADGVTAKLVMEASALSLRCGDLPNFVQTQNQLSFLLSNLENHKESLCVLRSLQPVVEKIGDSYHYLKIDFYNSVAYELNVLGEHDAAKRFASVILKSPDLKLYPEWQETAKEVFLKKTLPLKEQNKNNVLKFPLKKIIKLDVAPVTVELNSHLIDFGKCPLEDLAALKSFLQGRMEARTRAAQVMNTTVK